MKTHVQFLMRQPSTYTELGAYYGAKTCHCLSCFEVGVNDDGSDILFMNTNDINCINEGILERVILDTGIIGCREYSMIDQPTEVK